MNNCIYSKIALAEFLHGLDRRNHYGQMDGGCKGEKNDWMKKQEISQAAEKTQATEGFLKDGKQKKEAMAEEGVWQEEFKELCIRHSLAVSQGSGAFR